MLTELHRIRSRFIGLILVGLLLAGIAGMAIGSLFGLVSPAQLQTPRLLAVLGGFMALVCTLAALHFYRYFSPLSKLADSSGRPAALPDFLQQRLAQFGRDYWLFFLVYSAGAPLLYHAVTHQPWLDAGARLLQLLMLQLGIAALVGLPAYQLALDQIGELAGRLHLQQMRVSLKSKLLLMGGLVPLLCYTLLMNYQWQQTGSLTPGHMAVWLTLVCLTGVITLFSVRSVSRALEPIQQLIRHKGAFMNRDFARLQARSNDEIGFMTQIIGKIFRQLGEQESHMRTLVHTAAEGIIVINARGRIATFNPAAENLFGYRSAEMRDRSLQPLLPALFDAGLRIQSGADEREIEGRHRDGSTLQVLVRISPMRIDDEQYYTCLVADISRRKLVEQQLRDAETRYRDLVETAHDMVWTMDTNARLTYVNRACTDIYGYSPYEMLQHRLDEFRSPDHPPHDRDAIDALLAGEDTVQFETVHLDSENRPHFLSFSARSHKNEQGDVLHISGTTRDITEQKAFQHQLSYHAEHDPLTGLFNRTYFQEELERTVARTARTGITCALFYIDLDQFKYINDTLGHAAGDRLLVDIAALLSMHVREGDLLARFGGDEFTLLLYSIDRQDVVRVAENFRMLCDDYRFNVNDNSWNVSASIGIAVIDRQVSSAEEILSHADLACNTAKQQGRNRVNLYNPDDLGKADMQADMSWATRVREMLEHDRFQLVYQPIIAAHSGEILDYEVLVRMVCDDGQLILPGGFMPAAERFGLIHSVDRWIVRRAIAQLAQLQQRGMDTCFSINLSGKAFEDTTLLPLIRDLLESSGLDPSRITFEITETAAIANLAAAEEFIIALKDLGCQFALDDFGSGFSSFAYLKHLPVDKLKIDGAFVKGMAHSAVDQAMVESMNQVAHALGKQTVAECVENAESLQILQEMGVDRAQGFFIGRPQALPESGTPYNAVDDRTASLVH
jgi:diguanylate cyclase (GGDEF)-like protein/PAS domain S-box-containing protein